ncbi:MFS transporter [Planctomycetota bacterium]
MIEHLIFVGILVTVCLIYATNNPVGHDRKFRLRCFLNWFPLGLTYAFLYMGRYNLTVAKSAFPDAIMPKEAFGDIFGAGAITYAFSFLINGPLVDRIGGKKGILIGAAGSAVMNVLLGVVTYLVLVTDIDINLKFWFIVIYSLNMYFQSYGAVSIVKVNAYWFHVKERGVFGGIFGTLISLGIYFAFDWGGSIVRATKATLSATDLERIGPVGKALRSAVGAEGGVCDATWFVFFIPAAVMVIFFIIDLLVLKDTPGEAGFEDYDTGDASSGEMDKDFSALDLFKKIFTNPVIMTIAVIEFCSGVLRNGIMHWYRIFVSMNEAGRVVGEEFYQYSVWFKDHWGLLLCFAGICGGFFAGTVSDKLFQSRRGPSAAFMYMGMLVATALMTGVLVLGVGGATVRLSSVADGKDLHTLEGHEGVIASLEFSPDGKHLLSGSGDETIRVWDVKTGKMVSSLEGHKGAVRSIDLTADGKRLVSGGSDKTIRLWDLETGEQQYELKGHKGAVTHVSITPDGRFLASASTEKEVRLWDIGRVRSLEAQPAHGIAGLTFSPDGSTLATAGGVYVYTFDAATGEQIRKPDVATGKFRCQTGKFSCLAMSSDGRLIAAGAKETVGKDEARTTIYSVHVLDAVTGEQRRTFDAHETTVTALAFSPDGQTLASASADHTVKLWDMTSGEEIRKIGGQEHWVASLAFSPDGKTIASGSWDKDIALYTAAIALGILVILISLCVIGVHGLLSGTATMDFGGRKGAGTAVGVIDGFVYLGTGFQSICLGRICAWDWSYWPIFLIPFTIVALILSIRIWQAFPHAKRKGAK